MAQAQANARSVLDSISLEVTVAYRSTTDAVARLDLARPAVAEATDLPVVIYDIPVRTGRKVSTPLLVRLAHEVANITALKDAAGSPAETAARLLSSCGFDEVAAAFFRLVK